MRDFKVAFNALNNAIEPGRKARTTPFFFQRDGQSYGLSPKASIYFSEDVVVLAGGTKEPITEESIIQKRNTLDVLDPEGMKQRLEEKSMTNFLKVIRKSLEKSGLTESDIDYIGILHMKKSAHDYVLKELGLQKEQSIYLQDYGHMGQIDQILSLELAEQEGKIKNGDVVVLVSAGIGYAWGASTIRWGQ
jgi:3-oxoacyl-[acyl-carrier-protein] synthase-3